MKVVFAGGDVRTRHAAEFLAEQGFEVLIYHPSQGNCRDADAVVLPFPLSKSGYLNAEFDMTLDEAFSLGNERTLFLGGGKGHIDESRRRDYTTAESFLEENAILTVEGAVEMLMKHQKRAIHGENAVVLGFGRIGTRLAELLRHFGANVTVAARNDRVRLVARSFGFDTVGFDGLEAPFSNADVIFSTVPTPTVGRATAETVPEQTAVIELASFPGAFTPDAIEALGARFRRENGLPAKCLPISAGRALGETLKAILESEVES